MSSVNICKVCNSFNLGENHTRKLLSILQLLTGQEISEDVVVCEKCAKKVIDVHSFIDRLRRSFSRSLDCDDCSVGVVAEEQIQTTRRFRKILPKAESGQREVHKFDVKRKPAQRLYKCLECLEVFCAHRQLKAHSLTHQQNRTLSICEFCLCLYGDHSALAKHVNVAHVDQKYICLGCDNGKVYGSKGRLQQHLIAAHNHETLIYRCAICETQQLTYTRHSELELHLHEAHPHIAAAAAEAQRLKNNDNDMEMTEEFLDEFLMGTSDENSFQLSEWEALDLHLPDMLQTASATAGDSVAYTCPKCYEGCVDQRALLHHLAQCHEMRVLNCNKCEASFADANEFRRHKATHGSGVAAAAATAQRHHYQCEVCDKTFRSNAALIYHVKTHSRSATRPHGCPYCSKRFHTDTNLKQHLRIMHVHVKQKVCQLCDAQFATLDHLKKHVLSQHQNDRKHACPTCGQGFAQLCHLKQHTPVHERRKHKSPVNAAT